MEIFSFIDVDEWFVGLRDDFHGLLRVHHFYITDCFHIQISTLDIIHFNLNQQAKIDHRALKMQNIKRVHDSIKLSVWPLAGFDDFLQYLTAICRLGPVVIPGLRIYRRATMERTIDLQ